MKELLKTYRWGAAIVVLTSLLSFPGSLHAAERGRAKIVGKNVVAENGTPLRIAPFFMGLFNIDDDMEHNEAIFRAYFHELSATYHMNAVRIGPWLGNWSWIDPVNNPHHNQKFTYFVDKVVDWCEEEGMYAILNMHTKFNTPVNLDRSEEYWSYFAPRYKNRTHVIYEAINEPETQTAKATMGVLYQHIRSLAPDTHIILWSPPHSTEISVNELASVVPAIDYSNASFGFHVYDWTAGKDVEWDHAVAIREAGYPIICTEFFSMTNADFLPVSYDHLMENIKDAEQRNISWAQWGIFAQYRNQDRSYVKFKPEEINFSQTYLDELAAHGIPHWPRDTGVNSNTVSFLWVPSSIESTSLENVFVDYSTNGEMDIVVEVFDGNWNWKGQAKQKKNGSGVAGFWFSFREVSTSQAHLKVGIRPVGGDWTTELQSEIEYFFGVDVN